jgi:hypothetical protein
MPLFLLLQDISRTFQQGVHDGGFYLNDWDRLVALESLLVARAQSAFLVHWFGPRVPLHGFHLRIAIENLPALRARYQQVVGSGVQAQRGPNLTEPLAGMAGMVFGSLSSPINAMFLYERVARIMPRWYTNLAAALSVLSFGVLGTLITSLIGGASVLALPGALTSGDTIHVYNLLGAVAQMAAPFRRFWEIISGPRERVQNVVLRGILHAADQLAQLFPYVIALFSVLVTRFAPVIEATLNQLPFFIDLATAVINLVVFLIKNLQARLTDMGPHGDILFGPLRIVLRLMGRLPKSLEFLARFMESLTDELRRIGNGVRSGVTAWLTAARPGITAATTGHPFITTLIAFKDSMSTLGAALRSSTPPPPPPSPSAGPPPPPAPPSLFSRVTGIILPPTPSLALRGPTAAMRDFGTAPPTDVMALFRGFEAVRQLIPGVLPDPFALSQSAQRELAAARRPRSLIEPILGEVEQASDRAPGEALEERRLRDLMFEVVARVLPPSAYSAIAPLENILNRIDDTLSRQHPVRELAESNRLQPVVSRLRVRARDESEQAVRAWAEQLRAALEVQSYVAPASP